MANDESAKIWRDAELALRSNLENNPAIKKIRFPGGLELLSEDDERRTEYYPSDRELVQSDTFTVHHIHYYKGDARVLSEIVKYCEAEGIGISDMIDDALMSRFENGHLPKRHKELASNRNR